MMRLRLVSSFCLLELAGLLWAQSSAGPVLTVPANIQYPPIAKAAHVQGEVVVDFSIDAEGNTVSVQTLAGPAMLRGAVEGQIRQWHFKTPLPIGAQDNFGATYKFTLGDADEDLEDDLDAPPFMPCCGDMVANLSLRSAQVKGEVRSRDGNQTIDVTPGAAAPARDRCPNDKDKRPPVNSKMDDFVELYRTACVEGCSDYRVRIYRYGGVEWHGLEEVAIRGDRFTQITADAAEALLTSFQASSYWAACSVEVPSPQEDIHGDDFARGDYLTVSIDGHIKSVNTSQSSFAVESIGTKFAWALDKAANTHQWLHGDAASEPFANMRDDLQMPKTGMTALIRAVYRFNPATGERTLAPLKHLLAKGDEVDAADESRWTALMYAAELDPPDDPALKMLLAAHAGVNRKSLHGDTALMMAAYNGDLSQLLLAAGADINISNGDGVAALMLLAQYGNPEVLQAALAAGAQASAKDHQERTALDYLRAASCRKPIIPLPKWLFEHVAFPPGPPPCPSREEHFVKSEALLEAAMKKPSAH
jgi:uncharacterized protein